MKAYGKKIVLIVLFFLALSPVSSSQKSNNGSVKKESFEWILSEFLEAENNHVEISGSPKVIKSSYGAAVCFDGEDDAIFLDSNPLESFRAFTIEMIFNPALDGDFEQRIVHIGEVSQDRMLLEIRAKNGEWYFDGFVASKGNKKALIDSTLTHQLGKWYHVALVVKPKSLTTYVNGKKELKETYVFQPIQTGKSSMGVRLNRRSWFKGCIYKIKISPKAIEPEDFMEIQTIE